MASKRRTHRRKAVSTAHAPNRYSRTDRAIQIARAMKDLNDASIANRAGFTADTDGPALWVNLLNEALCSLANEDNVDTSATPQERATQMWTLLGIMGSDLDAADSATARENARRFLLRLTWHEGARLTKREQIGGGPGRGFFQFEMSKAKDGGDYAKQKKWLPKLAAVSSHSEQNLTAGFGELTAGTDFPANNLIHKLLRTHDLFGCYLARIALKRLSEAIPTTIEGHAAYWFKHWKVKGDEGSLTKIFIAAAKEVDKLV